MMYAVRTLSAKTTILYLLVTLFSGTNIYAQSKNNQAVKRWLISNACRVRVNGSTNINNFSCTIPKYAGGDTLNWLPTTNNVAGMALFGQVVLPVTGFDCGNAMMTADLRKTLRVNNFPVFYIQFVSMEKYPLLKKMAEEINGFVYIELAGVKKSFQVKYRIYMDEQGTGHLEGAQTIHFSDFNLVAPRKLGGMIRTNDQLQVEFAISFTII